MAEEKYLIPASPQYSEDIRKLQDSDPASASTVFNPLFERIIENIAAVKVTADQANGTANEAKTSAGEAKNAADSAQATADAALEAANGARSEAEAAQITADAAMELADTANTAAQGAKSTADTALSTANAAKSAAQSAAAAAANAQAAANGALEQLTRIANTLGAVPTQNGTLTYTGSAQTVSLNAYDPNKLTLGGTTSATNAGTYTATVKPKGDYMWPDGTQNTVNITWKIDRAAISVPTQSGSLTYTGAELTPAFSGYNSAKMTRGGAVKGTNAGSYNATFTPKANYQWSDGTTTAKTVAWSIGKAAGSLSLNKASMSLDVSTLTGTIEVTRAGDGAITATSSNTSVATVSVSGTTVTVTGKAKGSATITIKVAAGTNHTAPSSKTCSVTANLPSATLSDNTPAAIQQAAQTGTASNYWSVGDKIGIDLNGTVGALTLNSTYYAIIIGFDHNSSVEGNNSIHFQFGKTSAGVDIAFVDSQYGSNGGSSAFYMNGTNSNTGGWASSYMRNTTCPAFLSAMPSAWQSVIVACTKYSNNVSGSDTASSVTSTSDKIWLLSEFEVHGTRKYANSAEQNYQKQYDYYKNGNSKIKYKHDDTGSACKWLLRSVATSPPSSFCRVLTNGSATAGNAYESCGFAPGFKVA